MATGATPTLSAFGVLCTALAHILIRTAFDADDAAREEVAVPLGYRKKLLVPSALLSTIAMDRMRISKNLRFRSRKTIDLACRVRRQPVRANVSAYAPAGNVTQENPAVLPRRVHCMHTTFRFCNVPLAAITQGPHDVRATGHGAPRARLASIRVPGIHQGGATP